MAKGSESKIVIINKILEVFPGSFLCNDGKELRIPMNEEGAEVQIKVALTCAKENIGTPSGSNEAAVSASAFPSPVVKEVTEEEMAQVKTLLTALDL